MQSKYLSLLFLLLTCSVCAQEEAENTTQARSRTFSSVDNLIAFAMKNSINLQNDQIRLDQAKKERLSALIGTVDVTGNLLSAQYTDNTRLGVNLFPAEIFGGEPGTFKEVEVGVKYNTNLNNYLDIKLFNPNGYNNLKLADINIDLTEAGNLISIKQYQESLVSVYYNIINLQKQIENTKENIATSDSLLNIVRNKYEEGLIKQQEVNDTKVNHLQIEESLRQLEYVLEQNYLSLQALCDIDEDTVIQIEEGEQEISPVSNPSILLNKLNVNQSILQEQYSKQNLKAAKQSFLPTVSLQLSNSWNLYNTEFKPLSGDWINSNYLGLRVNVPIPTSQQIANRNNAAFEYETAVNKTVKERNQAEIDVRTLRSEYLQAQSQIASNAQIVDIQQDTYSRNRNLYAEGLIGLDSTIKSLNAVIAAEFDLISSQVNLDMLQAKINVNNKVQ